MTVNTRVTKSLGTRHRAAIGLSEETDAVALVVSEETGWLSLVLDGKIEPNLEPEQLKLRLEALMMRRRVGLASENEAREFSS